MQGFSKAPVELDGVKHEPIWPYGRAWLTIVNAVQAAVMVAIAQLVEHRVVVAGVAGSSPVSHPSQSLGTEVPRLFSSHRNSSCAPACRQACKYDDLLPLPPEVSAVPVCCRQVQELQLSVPGWLHGNPLHRAGCPRGRTGMSKRSCKSMDPVAQTHGIRLGTFPCLLTVATPVQAHLTTSTQRMVGAKSLKLIALCGLATCSTTALHSQGRSP